jgi:hypothetical protein
MSATDRIRLEIAFDGTQGLTVYLPVETAEELDAALARGQGSFSFEAEDGRYTVSVGKVVYVKRLARESRVGFGADA